MKMYKIEYNDFGEAFVVAIDFGDAEQKFLDSLEDRRKYEIKRIQHLKGMVIL
jgi:hypothetical protein